MKQVLHVGCGWKTIEAMGSGFHDGTWREVRFDIDERVRPDVVGTIVNMEAVPDRSMDAIWSSHNLEHVFHHEAPRVLREFRRILKADGFCVITCPDIENVCARVAAGSLTEELYRTPAGPVTALDVLYGHLASVARGEVHMAHKTGFDLRLLAARLQQAGFPRYFAAAVVHRSLVHRLQPPDLQVRGQGELPALHGHPARWTRAAGAGRRTDAAVLGWRHPTR